MANTKKTTRQRKGDTSRTSNQGQKLSSGGRKQTDNKGRPTADNPESKEDKTTVVSGRRM